MPAELFKMSVMKFLTCATTVKIKAVIVFVRGQKNLIFISKAVRRWALCCWYIGI